MFCIIWLAFPFVVYYSSFVNSSRHVNSSDVMFGDLDYRSSVENLNRNNSQNKSEWRILGGENCDLLWFLISFADRKTSSHVCCGTAIAPRWILTAASCVDRISDQPHRVKVLIGVTYLTNASVATTRDVDEFFLHKQYDPMIKANDIALAHLSKDFPLLYPDDLDLCYAQLPKKPLHDDLSRYCNPSALTATGWGAHTQYGPLGNKPNQLKCVNLTFIKKNECLKYSTEASDKAICTLAGGEIDVRPGDSGGPLLCRGFQLGIVSWVEDCTESNSPRFHARVDRYLDFIHLGMRNYRACGNQYSQYFFHLSIFLLSPFLINILN